MTEHVGKTQHEVHEWNTNDNIMTGTVTLMAWLCQSTNKGPLMANCQGMLQLDTVSQLQSKAITKMYQLIDSLQDQPQYYDGG